MKALIVYDTSFGNTAQIAQAIANSLEVGNEVRLESSHRAIADDIKDADLLIVGSPTQGGRPTPSIQNFIRNLPKDSLKGVSVAVFDTRFAKSGHGIGLRLVMNTIGFAAKRMGNMLTALGGNLLAAPEGFIVQGKQGPLKEGELDRAAKWSYLLTK